MARRIQRRGRKTALLGAVAATPGQVRRMIAWEATIVALVGSAAGVVFGAALGRAIAHGLVRHGIAPPDYAVTSGWLPVAAAVGSGVAVALMAGLSARRRGGEGGAAAAPAPPGRGAPRAGRPGGAGGPR